MPDEEQPEWLNTLEKHATLLVFDSVGHGLSTPSHEPADHTVEQRAAVVTAPVSYTHLTPPTTPYV